MRYLTVSRCWKEEMDITLLEERVLDEVGVRIGIGIRIFCFGKIETEAYL